MIDLKEEPIIMATDWPDLTDYNKLGEMVKKKKAEEKRFVKFDERKDDSLVSTEMYKLLLHGKTK